MSETDHEQKAPPPRQLHQEARVIRETSSRSWKRPDPGDSPFRQLVVALVLVVCLLGAAYLTASQGARMRVIGGVSSLWGSQIQESTQVYRLPPPPPRDNLPQIVVGQVPALPQTPLVPRTVPIGGSVAVYSRGEAQREEPYTPPARDAAFEQAFALLREQSEVIRKLASEELENLRLEGWDPLRADPPTYWFSLRVVDTSSGENLQLAWSIDVEASETQPQNQAARDLFFRLRRRGS